ncbi:MAG TPA: hypothetical protein VLE97_01710 [Gaiellaceae bacterium]|nr:hypothetical protein [Gaiellaceae bacterium]
MPVALTQDMAEQLIRTLLVAEMFLRERDLTLEDKHATGTKMADETIRPLMDVLGCPPLGIPTADPKRFKNAPTTHQVDTNIPKNDLPGFNMKTIDDCIDDFMGRVRAQGGSEVEAKSHGCAFAGGAAYLAAIFMRLRAEAHAKSPDKPNLDAVLHLFKSQTSFLDDAIGIYQHWVNEGKRPIKFMRALH